MQGKQVYTQKNRVKNNKKCRKIPNSLIFQPLKAFKRQCCSLPYFFLYILCFNVVQYVPTYLSQIPSIFKKINQKILQYCTCIDLICMIQAGYSSYEITGGHIIQMCSFKSSGNCKSTRRGAQKEFLKFILLCQLVAMHTKSCSIIARFLNYCKS